MEKKVRHHRMIECANTLCVRLVVVSAVLACSIWYAFSSASGNGEEECVSRSWTMFQETCRCGGPVECVGGCYRLSYKDCNDCIPGNSTCNPPSSQCWVVFSSTTCVQVAGGGCICAGDWRTKITPAYQGCN